jgi:hypothetical protein
MRDPGGAGDVRCGLALLVAGGLFKEILDGTGIAPAAPHIAASFGVPAVAVNVWTLQELGVAVGALLVRVGAPAAAATGLGNGADDAFRVAVVLLVVLLAVPGVEALRVSRTAGSGVTGRG